MMESQSGSITELVRLEKASKAIECSQQLNTTTEPCPEVPCVVSMMPTANVSPALLGMCRESTSCAHSREKREIASCSAVPVQALGVSVSTLGFCTSLVVEPHHELSRA